MAAQPLCSEEQLNRGLLGKWGRWGGRLGLGYKPGLLEVTTCLHSWPWVESGGADWEVTAVCFSFALTPGSCTDPQEPQWEGPSDTIFTISPHSIENTEAQRQEGAYIRPQSNMLAKVDRVSRSLVQSFSHYTSRSTCEWDFCYPTMHIAPQNRHCIS